MMKGASKRLLFSLFIFFCLCRNVQSASRIDPLVDTKVGLIRGLIATDGDYSKFTGIPYAYVEDTNPFGQSFPHPGFEGTFEAFEDATVCPQLNMNTLSLTGNLDCLHLNVYVPNSASSKNRLPVMVWIHGGGFMGGDSTDAFYGPAFLVRHDVILVTINYRLGPYGFMCLDTPEIPGNQGLKDQRLALKWVKNNIEAFGGDDSKITIFGESAGGVSVDLHLYYSDEKLFNQVLMQSGTALCPWGMQESDTSKVSKIAEYLGLKTNDLNEALTFLAKIDTKLVVAATTELGLKFTPCVEKDFEGVQNFINEHPLNVDLLHLKDFPLLVGNTNDESLGWLYMEPEVSKTLINDYLKEYYNFGEDEISKVEKLLTHFYAGDAEINSETLRAMINFDSDFMFNHPTARTIQKTLMNGAPNIYQYVFSYKGGRNFVNLDPPNGVAHADELGYLFSNMNQTEVPSSEDQKVIDRITTLWTNFAKYGNPTPETSELIPVTWPVVTRDTSFYLNIDSQLTIEARPFHERMAFWDLFYKLYYKAQKGYLGDEL